MASILAKREREKFLSVFRDELQNRIRCLGRKGAPRLGELRCHFNARKTT